MAGRDDPEGQMWAEACDMLQRAERLHRQFFLPRHAVAPLPVWHPPADMLETEAEVLILIALPGVPPEAVEAVIEDGALRVAGLRLLPAELRNAAIHRLELPQGRFERRIPLPPGRYTTPVRHSLVDGCLLVRLEKAG
ncbi:Hsp20/alpha crystallin family protein [Belnapia sp. T6]|uniref:Hsp20/alpha crystallin family protein n=1 Tax=Belnapia mucosa TaxID=2804532 RepID=A0ABS1UYX1_9PROT|nr:Hsp20/alpha crystallin family protein [Belnapia mucosa]MBL6454660.1 Hsp20/alpha crystallin family protein [Belnapia mucosa]